MEKTNKPYEREELIKIGETLTEQGLDLSTTWKRLSEEHKNLVYSHLRNEYKTENIRNFMGMMLYVGITSATKNEK